MAKRSSKSDTARAARARATPLKPLEQAQRNPVDRLRPALTLSELTKASAVTKAISARQKLAGQVRANLHLPSLESLTKRANEDRANEDHVVKSVAGPRSAPDPARVDASAIRGAVDHRQVPPTPEPMHHNASTILIASARDLGRLIRAEREKRNLSQQAFADLVGVGRRFISELENGKTTLEFDKVLQVASASGMDVLARRRG
jgi:y4mF family transcriptional regulator